MFGKATKLEERISKRIMVAIILFTLGTSNTVLGRMEKGFCQETLTKTASTAHLLVKKY